MSSEKSTGVNILVEIASVAIPATANAPLVVPYESDFKTLVGRSTGYNVDGERFEFDAEFGDPNNFWDSGSIITSRGWQMPFEAYFKNNDPAHQSVEDAVFQKTELGVARSPYVYLRSYPLGKIEGAKIIHGFATVDNLDNTFERAGSLDSSYGFTGEGELFRGRFSVPVYTSKTPATGAPGTAITYTGSSKMGAVYAVVYKQAGVVVAQQTTLTTRSDTGFTAAVPAGLASGTYQVALAYIGGEIAAANHTVS